MEDYFRIGVLTSPHGVRGEISVYPTTDDIERFNDLDECFLSFKGTIIPVHVEGCKYKKGMPVLKFKEYESIDDIQPMRNAELLVDRAHAIPLEEGEYYLADIIGFKVYSDDTEIGIIEDYIENEADQTIFVVKCSDNSTKYILDIPEFVFNVDIDRKKVYVNIIKGM